MRKKCMMSCLSVDDLKREANRGKTTHRMAALEILKEVYGIVPKRRMINMGMILNVHDQVDKVIKWNRKKLF